MSILTENLFLLTEGVHGGPTCTESSTSSSAPAAEEAAAWRRALYSCMVSRLVLMSVNMLSSLLVNW